ncbi:MAG: hypothetical protein DHS20C08_15350 [Rhodomicrobium sp.]|nr:MAG: hypothetical protein DHS20C08_15350 [Rhodomicrobium sp.]
MLVTSNTENQSEAVATMTDKDFADLGIQDMVYVNEIAVDTALDLFPEVLDLPDDGTLYSVHAADGTPILLAEDLESANTAAAEHSFTLHQVN